MKPNVRGEAAHLRLIEKTGGVPLVGSSTHTPMAPAAAADDPSRRAELGGSRRSLASDPSLSASPGVPSRPPEPQFSGESLHGAAIPKLPQGRALALSAELSDANLVALARQGHQAATEALYRRHVGFAIHLATRIEGSSRDVEDVVHDAFIKAFTRLADLSDPGAFRSWLGSIVVFAVRSRLRRTRLMNVLGLGRAAEPVDLDSVTSHDASPHVRAQLAQIYALLRTLPTDDRIAWTLRSVEGHELEVVARLTDCSLATVKRRISRAQKFLEGHFVDPAARDCSEEGTPPPSHARSLSQ